MTGLEAFARWSPSGGAWSAWVKPVLFAQMPEFWSRQTVVAALPAVELEGVAGVGRAAVVVDLPGETSVAAGVELARQGFQAVPLFNGAADGRRPTLLEVDSVMMTHGVCINVWPVVRALWAGAEMLEGIALPAEAAPAFLLDSRRRRGERAAGPGMFDNRWIGFPTDFPSARMLQERGIERALVVTSGEAPAADLAHTLLRWQEAGVAVLLLNVEGDRVARPIEVERPGLFRRAWYQGMEALGFYRHVLGGFGGRVPEAGSGG